MPLPQPCLEGIRILDLTRLLPGPFATWLLASMGAEIIKVEDTGPGDYARFMPPMLGGASAMHHVMNRGKRSIAVDLKKPEGRAIVLDLAAGCDVVFEQFRPGVIERLGIGWDALKAVKPDVILCSLTGYGQTGPLAHAAGHDMNYQALVGALYLQGEAGSKAGVTAIPMADLAGSWASVTAILGALLRRSATGEGAHLDIAMTDAVGVMAAPFTSGWTVEPYERGRSLLTGGLACYATFPTKDGRTLAVGALEPKFFARFADIAGHPEWEGASPYPGPEQTELHAAVAAVVAGRTLDEWVAALGDSDCCTTPVLTPAEAGEHPHIEARGLRGRSGAASWVESPFGPAPQAPAPAQGEHTDAILVELGRSRDAIASMRANGVVR
jgi:crotonobetainyl-CoA:carnitine CoA-transferase CaiB-like acyl-CoA transferase